MLRRTVTLALALAAVGLVPTVASAATPPLLGDWNFQSGSGTDLTGNWSSFALGGTASISTSGLAVSGNGSSFYQPVSSGWGEASGYSGPAIEAKTLVAWLKFDSTSGTGGGGLALSQYRGGAFGTAGQFDAQDYGERQSNQWAAGSDNFSRTQDFIPGASDTATGVTQQIAISYSAGTGTETITGCLNGQTLGSYSTGNATTFSAADAPVALFGPRTTDPFNGVAGGIDAHILESRIYGGAMTCQEVAALTLPTTDADGDGVVDGSDNCPSVANPDQADLDGDGQGDACDTDIDGDGVNNAQDAFPTNPAESVDTDGDGIGNNADTDDDNDGVPDSQDSAPLDMNNARPSSSDQCKNAGWPKFIVDGVKFKNQGDCVSWVATVGKNAPAGR